LKMFFVFLLVLLVVPGVVTAKDSGTVITLTVATSDFPPYYKLEKSGKAVSVKGFEVELDQHISAITGIEFEYLICPWAKCTQWLQSGNVDMVGAILKSQEREAFLRFSSSYYSSVNKARTVYFYTHKNSELRLNEYTDLQNPDMIIGVVRGDIYFSRFDHDELINKYRVASSSDGLDLLAKQRLDVLALLETPHAWLPVKYKANTRLENFSYSETARLHKAFSKKGRGLPYQEKIDAALKQLKQEGVVNSLLEKYCNQPVECIKSDQIQVGGQ